MSFDGIVYTRKELAKDLLAIEQHALDGSALEADCSCIQERHFLSEETHTEEGQALADNPEEKAFYGKVSSWGRIWLERIYKTLKEGKHDKQAAMYAELGKEAREIRVNLQDEHWVFPSFSHSLACGCKNCPPCTIKH